MILTFRLRSTDSGHGLCDIESVFQSYSTTFQKIEMSWQVEIRPIISQTDQLKSSVYFLPVRNSHYLTRD